MPNFTRFLDVQGMMAENNLFYKLGISGYPRVTLCGLGDPLIHPDIANIVRAVKDHGFFCQLVTNGSLLSTKTAEALVSAGLDELCISLHSVNPEHYFATMRMDLSRTIASLDSSLPILRKSKTKVSFWRIHHPDPIYRDDDDDEQAYRDQILAWKMEAADILGPSEPWSRDGIVPKSQCRSPHDSPFRCNKIPFTLNIDWQGNFVLCCCDYNRETVPLGNAFDPMFSYEDLFCTKKTLLAEANMPQICRECRRWSDKELQSIITHHGIAEKDFTQLLTKGE